ncbi:MAG: M28 family peptidase [Longimicrobiaceae bacterium]
MTIRLHRLAFPRAALALLLAGCGAPRAPAMPPRPAAVDSAALLRAADAITADAVRGHVAFLASDDLRGRDTPSPGLERAAEYLAAELRGMGLQPAGDGGSYLQRYPVWEAVPDSPRVSLTVEGAADTPPPVYGRDLFVVPSATYPDGARGLLFGSPRSYAASGRAVLVRSPAHLEGLASDALLDRVAVVPVRPPLDDAVALAPHNARAAGAAGLVLVLDVRLDSAGARGVAAQIARSANPVRIPTLAIRAVASRDLLLAAGAGGALASPPAAPLLLAGTLRLSAPLRPVRRSAPNVVAVLPGGDPRLRREYVVLTAHFDHVGLGAPDEAGDSVYNGADDNAGGTAAVLEIARALTRLERRPARSVLVVAVSGEDRHGAGSAWFAAHPAVPVRRVVADLNLHTVGGSAPGTVAAIGDAYSSLGPLAHRVAAAHPALGLAVAPDPATDGDAFHHGANDDFLRLGVPALSLSSLPGPRSLTPSDEVATFDADKTARVARLALLLAHAVADAPERPAWLPGGREGARRMAARRKFQD